MTPPGIWQAFRRQAMAHPQACALIDGERRWTYGALWHASQTLAGRMTAAGVRPGQRVVLVLPTGATLVCALYAAWAVGAVAVPVAERAPAAQREHQLDDVEPTLVVVAAKDTAAGDGPAAANTRWLTLPLTAEMREPPVATPQPAPAPEPTPDQLALILYTSGSRAAPKGVMLSHRNLAAAAQASQTFLHYGPSDTVLCALPLHHTYGLSQVFIALGQGACVVLERGVSLAGALIARLEQTRSTVLPATPVLLHLLQSLKRLPLERLQHLRLITCASDVLSPQRLQWVRHMLPHVAFLAMYGQTECGRASILPADEVDRRPGSVGRGLPGTEVGLVDDDGRRLDGPAQGELVVAGPHVMAGYWRRPQETALALRPDVGHPDQPVLHTGDVFARDAEGWLTFVARRDDLIKTRGERVGPAEIERVLLDLPGVVQAAVLGVPDVRLGQAIHAFVVLSPPDAVTDGQLRDHCRQHLQPHQQPQVLHRRADLPLTALGKIDKACLHAQALATASRADPP